MNRAYKAGAYLLALVTAVSAADAKPRAKAKPLCAQDNEVMAIQATAVQQQLMVAALTCSEVANFNAFQTGYNKEIRVADAALMKLFKRFYGKGGEAEYHAFKTRVANDSEMRSIHDNQGYCTSARAAFAAMSANHPVFANFVSSVPVTENSPVNACHISVAVNVAPTQPSAAQADQATAATDTTTANNADKSLIWQRPYGAAVPDPGIAAPDPATH
jgi:hypothetical protein